MQVKREKAIYHTLNKLSVDTSRKVSEPPCLCTHLAAEWGRGGRAGVGN